MKEELVFYSIIDFYPKKDILKNRFDLLTLEEKRIYKMYVYSLPWSEDNIKDLMWEYLNGWEESKFDLSKEYRIRKERNDKRQQKYDEEKL